MSEFLLTQIINYGAPILGAIVFLGALGIPFPATLIVIAAGAFCRQGFLPWPWTGLIALACVVVGDCLSYGMGHYVREPVLRRFRGSERWIQAENAFQRWGGMSVLLTRFLITGIAVPVNLIAGTSNFPFRRFFFYDFFGEAVWIFGYGGLGYLFGSQWEPVSAFLSSVSGLLLGLVILALGIWLALTFLRRDEEATEQVPEA
ncbi:MAG TPA: VTT domain-containing protein [Anaerolineales bacterium]|nr:VTT domain-containing protein [Anaerolineales bacterium]